MSKGYGFFDIIEERISKGIPRNKLEDPEYPDFSIYIGRTHVRDYETQHESRGLCKIGRAKYVNNIQRARNQGGGDFRVYAVINVTEDKFTREIEKYISTKYKHRKAIGSQNQTELYDISDEEIPMIVNDIETEFGNAIKISKIYI